MAQLPVVSVVIPTYEEGDYIYNALKSIMGQTIFDRTEVIIADYDPNLKDATMNAVNKFLKDNKKTHDNIKLLAVDKKGIGYARNFGSWSALAPIISAFDADAWYEKSDSLERLVTPLMEGDYYWSCCQNYPEDRSLPLPNLAYAIGNALMEYVPVGYEQGFTVSRFAFDMAGGFADTSFGEGRTLDIKLSLLFGLDKRNFQRDIAVYSSARRVKHMRIDNLIQTFDYFKAYRGDEAIPVV